MHGLVADYISSHIFYEQQLAIRPLHIPVINYDLWGIEETSSIC